MIRFRRMLRRRASVVFAAMVITSGVAAVHSTAVAVDTSPPTQPGTITVSSVTSSSAFLSWGPSSDDVKVEGYRVYRGPSSAADSSLSLIATTDAVTSYKATALYSGTDYKFGIVAIDLDNNKSQMTTTTFTTSVSSDTTAPAAPSSSSVSAKAFSSSRIDVVWGASTSSDVAGYLVYRDGTQVDRVDRPNGMRFSDNGLAASSSHSYVIKAVDSAGNLSSGTTGRRATTLASGTVRIARGPYLSNVTGTSAVVSWWTNLATSGTVRYGVSSTSEHSVTDPAGTVQHHEVTLTGLERATVYSYEAVSGAVSAGATFRTAADPGTTFSFAAIGDFGGGSAGATQNANNIASAGTSFIQTLGDNIYPSAGLPDPDFSTVYSDFDARFFKPFGTAVKSQAFFPANGNKEYYGDGQFWQAFPMLGSNHSWYSYDWGDAHILVLDSEQPFATGTDQYNFAQADLAGHQSATWRIVAIQRPPYSSTTANSSSEPVLQYLVPLFEQYNVALVLTGNSHNYERTYPLKGGSVVASGGITYVVSGGGGNGFNAFVLPQPVWSAFRQASYYEYVKVTVSPTSLRVDGIRADTNSVFDSTTIEPSTKPSPPTALTATANGSTEIDLSWTASITPGISGYNVYRDGTKLTESPITATSYADTGLQANTTYSYSVTAVDSAGVESDPATASATTGIGPGGTVTLAPTNDATISQVNPTTNYGTATTLAVDADGAIQDFLLKFAVPSTCASPTAANLTLRVGTGSNNNSARGGDFYAAPDNGWTEGSVTYASAPARTGSPVSLGAVALGTAYQVDVSSLLQTGLTNGQFSIRASTTSNDAAVYVSRNASGGNGPSLRLTCG